MEGNWKRLRLSGAAAYGGPIPMMITPRMAARFGRRPRYGRRTGRYRTGRTRRVGYYGRFGTNSRRGLNAPERKFLDTTYVDEAVLNSPTNNGSINLMAQGSGVSQHVGQKAVIRSVQAKLIFTLAPGDIGSEIVKVALVQDTQANGAEASGSDVYSGVGPGIVQLRDMENTQRFRVLWEDILYLDAGAGIEGAFSGDQKICDRYTKVAIPMMWGPTGDADIANIRSNNLFILTSSINNGSVTMTGTVRIRFTDN